MCEDVLLISYDNENLHRIFMLLSREYDIFVCNCLVKYVLTNLCILLNPFSVAHKLPPLSGQDAHERVRSVKDAVVACKQALDKELDLALEGRPPFVSLGLWYACGLGPKLMGEKREVWNAEQGANDAVGTRMTRRGFVGFGYTHMGSRAEKKKRRWKGPKGSARCLKAMRDAAIYEYKHKDAPTEEETAPDPESIPDKEKPEKKGKGKKSSKKEKGDVAEDPVVAPGCAYCGIEGPTETGDELVGCELCSRLLHTSCIPKVDPMPVKQELPNAIGVGSAGQGPVGTTLAATTTTFMPETALLPPAVLVEHPSRPPAATSGGVESNELSLNASQPPREKRPPTLEVLRKAANDEPTPGDADPRAVMEGPDSSGEMRMKPDPTAMTDAIPDPETLAFQVEEYAVPPTGFDPPPAPAEILAGDLHLSTTTSTSAPAITLTSVTPIPVTELHAIAVPVVGARPADSAPVTGLVDDQGTAPAGPPAPSLDPTTTATDVDAKIEVDPAALALSPSHPPPSSPTELANTDRIGPTTTMTDPTTQEGIPCATATEVGTGATHHQQEPLPVVSNPPPPPTPMERDTRTTPWPAPTEKAEDVKPPISSDSIIRRCPDHLGVDATKEDVIVPTPPTTGRRRANKRSSEATALPPPFTAEAPPTSGCPTLMGGRSKRVKRVPGSRDVFASPTTTPTKGKRTVRDARTKSKSVSVDPSVPSLMIHGALPVHSPSPRGNTEMNEVPVTIATTTNPVGTGTGTKRAGTKRTHAGQEKKTSAPAESPKAETKRTVEKTPKPEKGKSERKKSERRSKSAPVADHASTASVPAEASDSRGTAGRPKRDKAPAAKKARTDNQGDSVTEPDKLRISEAKAAIRIETKTKALKAKAEAKTSGSETKAKAKSRVSSKADIPPATPAPIPAPAEEERPLSDVELALLLHQELNANNLRRRTRERSSLSVRSAAGTPIGAGTGSVFKTPSTSHVAPTADITSPMEESKEYREDVGATAETVPAEKSTKTEEDTTPAPATANNTEAPTTRKHEESPPEEKKDELGVTATLPPRSTSE